MWIHHSCGSLMKIQMRAAEMMTVHLPMCFQSQPQAHGLDEVEEVLERVGEDEQQGAHLRELERHDADEAVVVQEEAHLEGVRVGPVAHRRHVDDGQVVDVERLVVGLVALERDGGELLEDALVDRVQDHARDGAHEGVVRDRERQEEARADDEDDDRPLRCAHPQTPPPSGLRHACFRRSEAYSTGPRHTRG